MTHLTAHLTVGGGWASAVLAGAGPGLVYLYGVARYDARRRSPWRTNRTAGFLLGCVLVAAALSPPVEEAAASGPTGHVVQHLLLAMYAPVALALGAPATLLLGAADPLTAGRIRAVLRRRLLRLPTDLWLATVLTIAGPFVLYLTPLHALGLRSDVVHHLVHAHLLITGYLFAWAVAGPDPAPHRPAVRWRAVALVVASGAHGFLAKYLYSQAPTLPPGTSYAPTDVETAAQWMYYGGHLAELVLAVALFARWYRLTDRTRPTGHTAAAAGAPSPWPVRQGAAP